MKFGRIELKSLQGRLVFSAGLVFVLVGGIVIAYTGYTSQQTAVETARQNAAAKAESTGNQIKAELEIAMDESRTLAQAFSAIQDKSNKLELTRDQANMMLRKVLESNPGFLGISTGWEPDAFDGKDADFVNTEAQ